MEGRYKASLVQEETDFSRVMKYIELNSVIATMVDVPGRYRWSSFCHNSGILKTQFISEYEQHLALGHDEVLRQEAYVSNFEFALSKKEMSCIRRIWQTGTPLGNDYFREKFEQQLNRKVGQSRQGRPCKSIKWL